MRKASDYLVSDWVIVLEDDTGDCIIKDGRQYFVVKVGHQFYTLLNEDFGGLYYSGSLTKEGLKKVSKPRTKKSALDLWEEYH